MTLKVSFLRVSWAHTSSRVALHSFTDPRLSFAPLFITTEGKNFFIYQLVSLLGHWLASHNVFKLHQLPFTIQYYNIHQLKENKHQWQQSLVISPKC